VADLQRSATAQQALVYRKLVGARVRSQLQYRTSFWLNTTGSFFGTLLEFGGVVVFFTHLRGLDGWTLGEMAVLHGLAGAAFGITDLAFGHLDRLGQMIRMGELDSVLVRPMGSLFQVMSSDFQLRRVGKVVQALAVLVVALVVSGVEPTPDKIGLMAMSIASSAVLFGAVWVTFSTICFWTADASEVTNSFTYGGNFLAEYPITIFGTWVRRLLAFVIPAAFVAYFPALYLLDRPRTGWETAAPFATPAVAALFCVVAGLAWRTAVRHYRSTGS
jgi:ABC-2 type transport system permease protein